MKIYQKIIKNCGTCPNSYSWHNCRMCSLLDCIVYYSEIHKDCPLQDAKGEG